jgi:hypothetical protein
LLRGRYFDAFLLADSGIAEASAFRESFLPRFGVLVLVFRFDLLGVLLGISLWMHRQVLRSRGF